MIKRENLQASGAVLRGKTFALRFNSFALCITAKAKKDNSRPMHSFSNGDSYYRLSKET